jgi:hypothetical protein
MVVVVVGVEVEVVVVVSASLGQSETCALASVHTSALCTVQPLCTPLELVLCLCAVPHGAAGWTLGAHVHALGAAACCCSCMCRALARLTHMVHA